jgi:tetratricopeptide (TPR) repeat protein
LEESLHISQDMGDKAGIVDRRQAIGVIARFRGDYEQASKFLTESKAYFQRADDKISYAWSLFYFSDFTRLQGNFSTACSLGVEALELAREIDERDLIAYILFECEVLSAAQGQTRQAVKLFAAADALSKTIHIAIWPVYRTEYDRVIDAVHAQLDEETFTRAWNEGQSMDWGQAVEQSLTFCQQLAADNH